MMIIRIEDIPTEGKEEQFDLDRDLLSARLSGEGKLKQNTYLCSNTPKAEVKIQANGRTVLLDGWGHGEFIGSCARCAEDAPVSLDIPIAMVLKPHGERIEDEVEDLQLSYYEGKEVNLNPIVEEQLILALPFAVLCRPDCRGLCSRCGANLNNGPCKCSPEASGDERFQPLKGLKLS